MLKRKKTKEKRKKEKRETSEKQEKCWRKKLGEEIKLALQVS